MILIVNVDELGRWADMARIEGTLDNRGYEGGAGIMGSTMKTAACTTCCNHDAGTTGR